MTSSRILRGQAATAGDLAHALARTSRRYFRGRPLWHGALWPHVANLTVRQALWRPSLERRCVWEIVRHITFWRHYVVERAAGRRPPNWRTQSWALPEARNQSAWQADLKRLQESYKALSALFRSKTSREILARNHEGGYVNFWWVGVLFHDSYHTGQTAVLRALMGLKPID